jgi:hypothetical protein
MATLRGGMSEDTEKHHFDGPEMRGGPPQASSLGSQITRTHHHPSNTVGRMAAAYSGPRDPDHLMMGCQPRGDGNVKSRHRLAPITLTFRLLGV